VEVIIDKRARARALVTAALAREPKLTAHGLYGHYGAVAKWGSAYLISDAGLDDVATCARWLEERRERWPMEGVPVYVVAGAVQRSTGRPIRNGVLIAAAIGLGFESEGRWYMIRRPAVEKTGQMPRPAV